MSVRKRIWKSPSGEPKEAWVVDYVDQHGDRHLKTFAKKRDADAHHAIVGAAVRAGTHTADSKSVTVAKAAELWLASCEAAGLERTTLAAYRQHADLHIVPVLGRCGCRSSRCRSCAASRSGCGRTGARRRWCARSAARSAAPCRRPGARPRRPERGALAARTAGKPSADSNGKLKVGIDIPSPDEIRAIVAKLTPQRTLAAAAADRDLHRAAGLGTARPAVERCRSQARRAPRPPARRPLRQDRANEVGSGERTVPLPPMVITALREHRLACPKKRAGPRLRQHPGRHRASQHHRRGRLSSGTGRGRYRRSARRGQVQRPALAAPLLCVLVHQPARRWRPRTAAQGGAGAPRSCLDPDDRRHLRPPVPAQR